MFTWKVTQGSSSRRGGKKDGEGRARVHIKQITTVGNCGCILLEDSGSQGGACMFEFSCLIGEGAAVLTHYLLQLLLEGCFQALTP